MKLIIAILHDDDYEAVSLSLLESNFRVTRIASTGGFLRRGSSTLMIGVTEERVDEAIDIIKKNTTQPDDAGTKRATLFVLNIDNFTQL
jgi:uncharacterized protein YaaQ